MVYAKQIQQRNLNSKVNLSQSDEKLLTIPLISDLASPTSQHSSLRPSNSKPNPYPKAIALTLTLYAR